LRLSFCRDFIQTADGVTFVIETAYWGKDPGDREYRTHEPSQVTVTNMNTVSELVSRVQFVAKTPCMCGHSQEIVFHRGSQKLTVSVCSHCFDVIDDLSPQARTQKQVLRFEMPERVWEMFQYHWQD